MGFLGLPPSVVTGSQQCSKRPEVEYAGPSRPGPENGTALLPLVKQSQSPDSNGTLALGGVSKSLGPSSRPLSNQTPAVLSLLPHLSHAVSLVLNAFLTLSYFLPFLQDYAQEFSPQVFLNPTYSRV